jgi:hypothetical protein
MVGRFDVRVFIDDLDGAYINCCLQIKVSVLIIIRIDNNKSAVFTLHDI